MADRSRLSFGEASSFDAAALPVALVGTGRVGRAFGRALAEAGHDVVAVVASSPERAGAAADEFGARASSVEDAARSAGLVVLAVPDDVLEGVVARVAPALAPGTWVIHTSGRCGAALLAPCGERVAAVHPAAPIAEDSKLDGIAFGVTCSDAVWPFASRLAMSLGGFPVRIDEERRVLYHAALVIGSNFTTALAADAASLAGGEVVFPLMRAAIENLQRMPSGDALTGPVVRGDAGTIRAHRAALQAHAPHLLEAYVAVSKRLLAQAREAGRIDDEGARRVEEALGS